MITPAQREAHLNASLIRIKRDPTQSWFVCPDCGRATPHPMDVHNSYCPWCHTFQFDDMTKLRCFEPTCPNFGDPGFGADTCPVEHAVPAARRGLPTL